MIRRAYFLMGFSACLAGCHGASSVPPAIERLAEELPVETSRLRFLNCKINGQDENATSLIRMSPGESFSFEGEIVSGDWDINRIHQTWRTEGDDSSYSETSSGMRGRPLELSLRIHGNNVSVDGGVVAYKQVQSRENKNHPNHLEFRVAVETRCSDPMRRMTSTSRGYSTCRSFRFQWSHIQL